MKKIRTRPADEMAKAIALLLSLDVVEVDRCPAPECPLCGPALPQAA